MQCLGSLWTLRQPQLHPYVWFATEPGELFMPGAAEELSESFPMTSYTRLDTSHRSNDKTYRNYSRQIIAPDGGTDLDLPVAWRNLIDDLMSPGYRSAVARLLGQEPSPGIEIRLVRHGPGDWLGPHTDRADKLFSHVLYFNPGWQEQWGGCIEILDSNPSHAVVARIAPRLGASSLLARSDRSWHQVSPVATAGGMERRSLLVHGLREPPRS